MRARLPIILLAAGAVTCVPAGVADAATKFPSVSKIQPNTLSIGETMTIHGKNFVRGKNRNTVVFKRDGKRAIFAKASTATSTKLTVVVPEKVRPFLKKQDGKLAPTTFRLRILSKRFGKRYTSLKASPRILPAPAGGGSGVTPGRDGVTGPGTPPPPSNCDGDALIDDVDEDDDNDLMTDGVETLAQTDRCARDTDSDGLSDYWEWQSALDLNSRVWFPPHKTPYPNPRFGDGDVDYDGDGMLAWQEHEMWVRFGGSAPLLNYSDGTQNSDAGAGETDDRRDVDADGLANWWEANGPMRRVWWEKAYDKEKSYGVTYRDPDFLDPDSDGDGVLDGPDDLDHDGYANQLELSRSEPLPDETNPSIMKPRWVQPHNPCLPDPDSPTCSLHPPLPLRDSWPPFDTLGFPVADPPTIERPLPW